MSASTHSSVKLKVDASVVVDLIVGVSLGNPLW